MAPSRSSGGSVLAKQLGNAEPMEDPRHTFPCAASVFAGPSVCSALCNDKDSPGCAPGARPGSGALRVVVDYGPAHRVRSRSRASELLVTCTVGLVEQKGGAGGSLADPRSAKHRPLRARERNRRPGRIGREYLSLTRAG